MKQIIEEDGLNKFNDGILHMNGALGKIFSTPQLHISTLRVRLEEILIKRKGYEAVVDAELEKQERSAMFFWKNKEDEANYFRHRFHRKVEYMLPEKLAKALNDALGIKTARRVYPHYRIYGMILEYLSKNRARLETGTSGIYFVYGDPLGEAFEVDYLDEIDIPFLIKKQIHPSIITFEMDKTESYVPFNPRGF
jgi:hypothetical protein